MSTHQRHFLSEEAVVFLHHKKTQSGQQAVSEPGAGPFPEVGSSNRLHCTSLLQVAQKMQTTREM